MESGISKIFWGQKNSEFRDYTEKEVVVYTNEKKTAECVEKDYRLN